MITCAHLRIGSIFKLVLPDATQHIKPYQQQVIIPQKSSGSGTSPSAQVKMDDGQTYKVVIQVTYKLASEIKPEMIGNNSSKKPSAKTLPDQVKQNIGYQEGDNILEIDNAKVKAAGGGYDGKVPNQGASTGISKAQIPAILEETFHQLGFDERYIKPNMYDGDFSDKIMGPEGTIKGIHNIHFYKIAEYFYRHPNKTNKPLSEAYQLDDTGQGARIPTEEYQKEKEKADANVVQE